MTITTTTQKRITFLHATCSKMTTTALQHSKIVPSSASVPEFSQPLIFLDILWYRIPPNQNLLFFELPNCSKSSFLNDIVPKLKSSLADTLSHFLPLASNVIHPLKPGGKPTMRYQSGDSVSFTVAESSADFNHLTGNHPRVCLDFYPLAPTLESPIHSGGDTVACPVSAIQVTLFPNFGFSIGLVTRHIVVDACSIASFMNAWALINSKKSESKSSGELLKDHNQLPSFDKSALINFNGLDSLYWEREFKSSTSPPAPSAPLQDFPTDKIRGTVVLRKDEIQKLKNLVTARFPGDRRQSTFTVVCALLWYCNAASAAAGGDAVADDEPDRFVFAVECRGRTNPPLPTNYFGNCIAVNSGVALKHGEVKGRDGYFKAVESIRELIKKKLYDGGDVLSDAAEWQELLVKWGEYSRTFGVAWSPRFDMYAADFGWGKPKKFEVFEAVSLSNSREFEGGLEIGMTKTMRQWGAFEKVLNGFLKDAGVGNFIYSNI